MPEGSDLYPEALRQALAADERVLELAEQLREHIEAAVITQRQAQRRAQRAQASLASKPTGFGFRYLAKRAVRAVRDTIGPARPVSVETMMSDDRKAALGAWWINDHEISLEVFAREYGATALVANLKTAMVESFRRTAAALDPPAGEYQRGQLAPLPLYPAPPAETVSAMDQLTDAVPRDDFLRVATYDLNYVAEALTAKMGQMSFTEFRDVLRWQQYALEPERTRAQDIQALLEKDPTSLTDVLDTYRRADEVLPALRQAAEKSSDALLQVWRSVAWEDQHRLSVLVREARKQAQVGGPRQVVDDAAAIMKSPNFILAANEDLYLQRWRADIYDALSWKVERELSTDLRNAAEHSTSALLETWHQVSSEERLAIVAVARETRGAPALATRRQIIEDLLTMKQTPAFAQAVKVDSSLGQWATSMEHALGWQAQVKRERLQQKNEGIGFDLN